MTLLHLIPHRAGLSSAETRCTLASFYPVHTNTTVHLTGRIGCIVLWPFMSATVEYVRYLVSMKQY